MSRSATMGSLLSIAVVALACVGVVLPTIAVAQVPDKPNVLYLFADDMTYDAISALGNDEIITPNLDSLVQSGTAFTHAYNQGSYVAAVCRSSRDMLESGRFLWNAATDLAAVEEAGGLAPQVFADNGYDTYFSGKWHLSVSNAANVYDNVGTIRPALPTPDEAQYNRPLEGQPDPWDPADPSHGGFWAGGTHWTEVLADEGIDFLQSAAADPDPFYMQLSFNAPHDPRQAPQEYLDMYSLDDIAIPPGAYDDSGEFIAEYPFGEVMGSGRTLRDERIAPFPRTELAVRTHRLEYYAAITYMDAQIGRVLDELANLGEDDETIVVFTADHGLSVGSHGLMGKQNMFEHSVRAPLVFSGPGIPAAARNDTRVYYQDSMPTLMELTGATIPETMQFKSLVPLINGAGGEHWPAIYGSYILRQRMVIKDNVKLILYPNEPVALLFDLDADPYERTNVIDDPAYAGVAEAHFAELLALQHEVGDTLDLLRDYPEYAPAGPGQLPESGNGFRLPATIEAESFDRGGEGVAYSDSTAQNDGGALRPAEGVDVYATGGTPSHVVGDAFDGEWMEYTIYAPETDSYELAARYASLDSAPGELTVEVDGTEVSTAVLPPSPGTYGTEPIGSLDLTRGFHVLRVSTDGAPDLRLDAFVITSSSCAWLEQQAEEGTRTGAFQTVNDSSAVGGAALTVPEGSGKWYSFNPANSVSFCIEVGEAGTYNLEASLITPDRQSDSVFVQIDGSSPQPWHMRPAPTWVTQTAPQLYRLAAGLHSVELTAREDGVKIDEVRLVLDTPDNPGAITPTPTPIATPTPVPTSTATPLPPTCGGLRQEAEDAALAGAFRIGSDSTASGGSFVGTLRGDGNWYALNPNNRIDFCMTAPTASTYVLDVGLIAPDLGSDSVFVSVNGSPPAVWHMWPALDWASRTARIGGSEDLQTFTLPAGEHSVSLIGREDEVLFDWVELVSTAPSPSPEPVCGGLSIEAEDAVLTGAMTLANDVGFGGAAGGQYVTQPTGTGNWYVLDPSNALEFCATVPQAGTYALEARVRAPDRGSDSFFVQVDGSTPAAWHMRPATSWADQTATIAGTALTPQTFALGAGEHTVRLIAREDGVDVDSIRLVRIS